MNGGLRLVARVGLLFLRMVYAAFKLGRQRDRIILIGTQSDDPSLDIRLVAAALRTDFPTLMSV